MKKLRGLKLGRNLVRVYRCLLRRRHRPRYAGYLRLGKPTSSSSHQPPKPTVAGRVLTWGRVLTKQLRSINGGDRSHNRLLSIEEQQPSRPPKGHVAVYVGKWEDGGSGLRRYLVPVMYFNHPLFGELLREAEEAYGLHHPGVITIPCPVSDFEKVRTRVEAANGKVRKKLPWF